MLGSTCYQNLITASAVVDVTWQGTWATPKASFLAIVSYKAILAILPWLQCMELNSSWLAAHKKPENILDMWMIVNIITLRSKLHFWTWVLTEHWTLILSLNFDVIFVNMSSDRKYTFDNVLLDFCKQTLVQTLDFSIGQMGSRYGTWSLYQPSMLYQPWQVHNTARCKAIPAGTAYVPETFKMK